MKSEEVARISVIIPVYNRGARVLATVESALSQTLAPLEIIIVDDGSTDQTPQILARAYAENPRVVLLRQENAGVAAARNFGLEKARGAFIAFLDHDDLWHAEKLEAQAQALREYSRAGVCYCLWREVDESGSALPDEKQTTHQSWWKAREGRVFSWFFTPRNPLISMSVPLLRTQLLRDIGGFDARTVPVDDWDLWLRLARRTEFAFVPRVLVDYTRHEAQQSLDMVRVVPAVQRMFRKYAGALLLHPALLWYALTMTLFHPTASSHAAVKAAWWNRDLRRARCLTRQLLKAHPAALLTPQWLWMLARLIASRLLRRP